MDERKPRHVVAKAEVGDLIIEMPVDIGMQLPDVTEARVAVTHHEPPPALLDSDGSGGGDDGGGGGE